FDTSPARGDATPDTFLRTRMPTTPISVTPPRKTRSLRMVLPDYFEGARPACFGKEVGKQVRELLDAIAHVRLPVFVGVGFERPIDDQGLADNEIARDESPITAVRAVVAVISHREVMIGRHNDLLTLYKILVPVGIFVTDAVETRRVRLGRK